MVVNMNMHTEKEGNINQYLSDTIANVFNTVYTVNVDGNTNRELFATQNTEVAEAFKQNTMKLSDYGLRSLMGKVAYNMKIYEKGNYLLTDDKAPVELLGMQVIDEWVVTLVSNVKEISVDAIKLALGVATSETSTSPTGYTKITANSDIATGDYLTNLTWVGTLSGSDKPVIIVVKNALSINGLSLAVADKNEAVIPITVTGNYDADDLEEAPFDIYYPTAA
jgi:hypothetical protein